MRNFVFLTALLASATVAAQPPSTPQPTLQARFDAASSALGRQDWPEAVRLFEALESQTSNPRTLAVIRIRKSGALMHLGRVDDAAAILTAELPRLPADDASLDDDRFTALLALGGIAERQLDYIEALRQYRAAAALRIPEIDTIPARRGIIQTSMFSDPETSLREADAALVLAAAGAPANHQLQGALETLKGRALLNLGRFAEGRASLDHAMRLLGGLTLRVDQIDLTARSDLAIAAMLAGAREDARRYLAYTGAGQFPRGYLRLSATAGPPRCGGELAPNDVAVIQAAVADDGRVISATPIYASRRGSSAVAFARAVTDWSFTPESVASIPAFFRAAARFEVRCLQYSHDRGYAESVAAIRERMAAANPALPTAFDRLRHISASQLRQELTAGGQTSDPALLPKLVALGFNESAPAPERATALRHALTVAAGPPGSPSLLASLALAFGYASTGDPNTHRRQDDPPDYEALLALPEILASPRAAIEIRLARARHDFNDDHDDRALAAATEISNLPAIAADDVLKIQALEIITAVRAAQGNPDAARAAHAAMGARASRCSYFARRKRLAVSSQDFPQGALRWGFEGWATGEVMVGPNGTPRSVRTVVAYPAFTFAEAEEEVLRSARFDPVFVVDDGACPGFAQTINFRLP